MDVLPILLFWEREPKECPHPQPAPSLLAKCGATVTSHQGADIPETGGCLTLISSTSLGWTLGTHLALTAPCEPGTVTPN